MLIRTLPLALALLVLLPQAAAADTSTRIIVKREPGLSTAERADIRADAGVRFVESLLLPRAEVVAAPRQGAMGALRTLQRDRDVEYAQIDHRRSASYTLHPALWAFRNTAQQLLLNDPSTSGLVDADSDIPAAWEQTTRGEETTGEDQLVAVVDSGVASAHPDLAGQIAVQRDFVGDGPPGMTAPDGDGHGTHVSGTIAALRDNNFGVSGVAPAARLMALRALDGDGSGRDSDIAEAFYYAGDSGARVVNASFGGDGNAPALEDAIEDNPDTLFVIAAGNDGSDNDVAPRYPCNLQQANVLCVGASTNRDRRAGFSNFGDTSVDLFAPGELIASTYPPNTYVFLDGTSMAAPHVAATAALVWDAAPTFSVDDVKDAILESVDVKPALAGLAVTGGRLNAAVAVARARAGGADPTDSDDDGEPNVVDLCPQDPAPGMPDGCPNPDSDGDTRLDASDNCREDRNLPQTDSDQDGSGDVCDATPRGPDSDGDGKPLLDDSCPTAYGSLPNGCPAPAPAPVPANSDGDSRPDSIDACPTETANTRNGCPLPALTKLSGKVTKRGSRRYVTVRASTSRAATVRILVQRKKGKKWVKVKKRTLASRGNRVKLTVSRLRRGRHRIVVAVYSNAGSGTSATRYFRVR